MSTVGQIGGFGHWFLEVADKIDRLLYGRRTQAIAVMAIVTIVAAFVDNPRLPVFTALSTWLFTLLLFMLVIARTGSVRDEDGRWSLTVLGQKISAWWDGARELSMADGTLIAQALGKTAAFLGLLVLGLRNTVMLLVLIADEIFGAPSATLDAANSTMSLIGTASLSVGTLVLLLTWLRVRSIAKSQGFVLDNNAKAQLKDSIFGWPSLIDCSNASQVRALIGQAPHPLLKQLLETLVTWRPRNADNEQAYHASLYRTLLRRMPGASPEKERPIAKETPQLRGRADIVLGDSILIELKARLTKATAQRAIGQLRMYARAWTQGPILLVICGSDMTHAHQLLSEELAELHQKAPVFMVLIGR